MNIRGLWQQGRFMTCLAVFTGFGVLISLALVQFPTADQHVNPVVESGLKVVLGFCLAAACISILPLEFTVEDRKLVVRVITIGVLRKAFYGACILCALFQDPKFILIAMSTAQVDPTGATVMSQHTTINDRLKSIMRTWASCDDPVTVIGTIAAACAIWLLKHFGIGNGVEIGLSVDSLEGLWNYFLQNYMLFCCSFVGWYGFGLLAKTREWSQRWRLVTLVPAMIAVIVSGSLLYLMLGIVIAFIAIGQHLHDTEEQVYQKISGWMESAAVMIFWIGVVLAGVLLQRNVDPYAMLQGVVTGCIMYAVHWRVTGGLVKGYTQATGNPEGLTDIQVGYLRRFHVGGVTALLLLAQMGEVPLALGYVGTTQLLCIGFTSHYRRQQQAKGEQQ